MRSIHIREERKSSAQWCDVNSQHVCGNPDWSCCHLDQTWDFCIPISVGLFLKSTYKKYVTHCFWGPFSSANMQPKYIALTAISVNDATSLKIFLCNGVKLGFHPSSDQFTDLRSDCCKTRVRLCWFCKPTVWCISSPLSSETKFHLFWAALNLHCV